MQGRAVTERAEGDQWRMLECAASGLRSRINGLSIHVAETRPAVPIYASDMHRIAKNPPRHRQAKASKGA
jgi:hypothetical protein